MRLVRGLFWMGGLAALAAIAFSTRHIWSPRSASSPVKAASTSPAAASKPRILELSEPARRNLGLVAKPAKLQSYWRTVLIPGAVTDRPGITDRGVTSPVVGVVAEVHAFPGDTVRAGQPLFTIRLFSEYLQNTQSELFKAVREVELVKEQSARLQEAVKSGAVSEAKVIELNNQLRRQNALILAYRQDLLTRGLRPEQIEQVSEGKFVSTIDVVAPPPKPAGPAAIDRDQPNPLFAAGGDDLVYEVQDLAVELGQQVQAGQLLVNLSNHRALYVVGHAFKQESRFLEQAARDHREITIEFAEDDASQWPPLGQTFQIRHLANAIDPASRTFDFFIPLLNQSRSYEKENETFVVWRFRPGQRVRLHVPVEEYRDVFVLPAAAIVHEGPEAFAFRQNGDLFDRRAVHVLHEDRLYAVIASGGEVTPGMYLAQGAAASLNRVLKAQAASGEQPGLHVHPDGTVHAAH